MRWDGTKFLLMSIEPFEHRPLDNVIRGIAEPAPTETDEELRESLRRRGLDPAAAAERAREKVQAFLRKKRLAWREGAAASQQRLDAAMSRMNSWRTRPRWEIEDRFADVQRGTLGPNAQARLQVAFRNLANVSVEDKAGFLDDVDLLAQMGAEEEGQSTPPGAEPCE